MTNKSLTNNKLITIGEYSYFLPYIGKGSFSRVYYGYHNKSEHTVAIKKINKTSINKVSLDRITNEIELMKKLDHVNIVRYIDMMESKNSIYIVTEYCNGFSLQKFIEDHRGFPENFPEEEVKIYMIQIKNGLEYLISKNIYHRDLKPHNIFINYNDKVSNPLDIVLKIGDFGFAKEIQNDDMETTLCGTPMYISPEIIYEKRYHINSDLWSIGIILFQLIYGYFPFGTPKNILDLMKNIDSTTLKFPLLNEKEGLSRSVHDLLTELLKRNPKERISWNRFFTHRWFDKHSDISVDMMETMELNDSILDDQLMELYIDNKIPHKHIVDDTKKKIVGKIDVVDNYCDKFSMSMPIAIPTKKQINSFKGSYGNKETHSKSEGSNITDSIYNYINYSIDKLKSVGSSLNPGDNFLLPESFKSSGFLWK